MWRFLSAIVAFAIVGFLIAQSSSAVWGVLFGLFGFGCYGAGYFVGQALGSGRR